MLYNLNQKKNKKVATQLTLEHRHLDSIQSLILKYREQVDTQNDHYRHKDYIQNRVGDPTHVKLSYVK